MDKETKILVENKGKSNNESVQANLEWLANTVMNEVDDNYDIMCMAQALTQMADIMMQKVLNRHPDINMNH